MKRRYRALIGILLVLAVIFAGFIFWAETPPSPLPEALDALNSDSSVAVSVGNWLVFTPLSSHVSTGFIIYPGGRVDFRSYAYAAHAIATEGYLVIIPKMPLNLAVFGIDTANEIVEQYPDISSWAIGGHSLGGTMAAQFAAENPSKIKGLVLWAAYPASGTDLSKSNLSVITIYGSNDGLVSTTQIDDSLRLLPPSTVRVEITGGNHAQFGWYGEQAGDNAAAITIQAQQNLIVKSTIQLLQKI